MCRLMSIFALALLITSTIPVSAQTKSGSKSSNQAKSAAPSKKSASENTCDGALDIVPSETLSFQRKRRPPAARQPASESTQKKTQN